MPRFYSDVSKGPTFIPDEQGFELDRLVVAEHEATQTLFQLGRDWLPRCLKVCVQVRDERHQTVLALSIAMRVQRWEHLPRPP